MNAAQDAPEAPCPPGSVPAPGSPLKIPAPRRGQAAATTVHTERVRAHVAAKEAETGLPALSVGQDSAALLHTFVKSIHHDPRTAALGGGERLYVFIHAIHADRSGSFVLPMNRLAALMGVNADSVTAYHRAAVDSGALTAQQTRRDDGYFSKYRTTVEQIAQAAARDGGRQMRPEQCAVILRWGLALLSDEDVSGLSPDDRWRLVRLAARFPDGVFYGTRADLARLWDVGVNTAATVIGRFRKAGVLRSGRRSGRTGLSEWTLTPVAAAVASASIHFDTVKGRTPDAGSGVCAGQSIEPKTPARPEPGPADSEPSDQQVCGVSAGQSIEPKTPAQYADHPQDDAEVVGSVVSNPRGAKSNATSETSKIPSRVRVPAEDIDRVLAGAAPVVAMITTQQDRHFVRSQVAELLRAGTPVEQLAYRVARRYRDRTSLIHKPAGWLARRALSEREGCAVAYCEDGLNWETGKPCPGCRELWSDRRTGHTATTPPVATWTCSGPNCGLAGRGERPESGRCPDCYSLTEQAARAACEATLARWAAGGDVPDPDPEPAPEVSAPARDARKAIWEALADQQIRKAGQADPAVLKAQEAHRARREAARRELRAATAAVPMPV